MSRATITYFRNLSNHPFPVKRGRLVLEMAGTRLEASVNPRTAEQTIAALQKAFGAQVEVRDDCHGFTM